MDKNKKRHIVQILWTIVTNSYITGFTTGKIYRGSLKKLCVPGLNCYSCPAATCACPIGALQSVIGSRNFKFSYYMIGFFFLVGALAGRFVCGWFCPFGLIQEILHKLPFVPKVKTIPGDKYLRLLKYVILFLFVILLPMFYVDIIGQGSPYFCKLICPAGTLEAGLPLVLQNPSLQNAIGFLFHWKIIILLITLLASVIIYRPFCKYLCPLGAIYSLFNPISIISYRYDADQCTDCGLCAKSCEMNLEPTKDLRSLECIRCGKCANACPTKALHR